MTAHRSRTSSSTSVDSLGTFGSPSIPTVGLVAGPHQGPSIHSLSEVGHQVHYVMIDMLHLEVSVSPPAVWIIDQSKYLAQFVQADADCDEMVSGADVKSILADSGLAHNYLAHIWALVDINKTGRLNLEQFALAMHMIEQKCQHDQDPPTSLSPDLIPPSFRPNPAGMTDTSTSTNLDEHSAFSTGNKELNNLINDIDTLRDDRRRIDSEMQFSFPVQLEANMTVKQSEIKNLELELHTLETTVHQLERQRGEAGRRLVDLDSQKTALLQSLQDLKLRNDQERQQVTDFSVEAQSAEQATQAQEEQLSAKRTELQSLRDEERRLEVELQNEKANLDTTNRQYGALEADIHKTDAEGVKIEEQNRHLEKTATRLEQLITLEDLNALTQEETTLLRPLDGISPKLSDSSQQFTCIASSANPAAYYDQVPDISSNDPFASRINMLKYQQQQQQQQQQQPSL